MSSSSSKALTARNIKNQFPGNPHRSQCGEGFRHYCGCSSPAIVTPDIKDLENMKHVLGCDCDRNNVINRNLSTKGIRGNSSIFMQGGGDKEIEMDVNDHLYPETGDSPFSDKISSDAVNSDSNNGSGDDKGNIQQTGGDASNFLDSFIVGKTVKELKYLSIKGDYLKIRNMK